MNYILGDKDLKLTYALIGVLLLSFAAALALAQAPAATGAQPDLTTVKADFIPGDKTLFYDDFTDMAGDEPPPHWKVRGGAFALKTGPGIRQLTTTSTGTMIPNLKGLPKNFTIEAEIKFDNPADFRSVWTLKAKNGDDALRLFTQAQNENLFVRLTVADEDLGSKATPVDWNQPVKLAAWLQNGRLRVYIGGNRLIDVNQVTLPDIASAEVLSEMYGEGGGIGYRMVRFAESTPDFSQVISSSGRYVTHGILFDTDSDRLKPESAPVIKAIARGLETNPNLKLLIEGHTDSTGNAQHNLDLSKRRAEAVKAVLVSQFNVDAARLTTAGLGAAKPMDSNGTAAGRAQNRRVEFVRQ
jgi:OOP family OmpA-OmpF porin